MGSASSVVYLWFLGCFGLSHYTPSPKAASDRMINPTLASPFPISHRSCLVDDSQHPMGLCMAGASSSLSQALLTAYLLALSLRGPAGVFPLHPEPLTAAFCRLRYSFDCRTLALALNSKVSKQSGCRCCHKTSAAHLHWSDFCVPAMMPCFGS